MVEAAREVRPVAVSVREVGFRYPSPLGDSRGVWALEGVSLEVRAGERLGILGPNGGGKSTLIKLMLGLLEPTRGRVEVLGMSPREAVREGLVGYVAQRCEAELSFPVTGRQAVMMSAVVGLSAWRGVPPEVEARVDRALGLVGASGYSGEAVGRLSGGQLQRVLIARALARGPRVLLLDEPTVGVDPAGQRQFSAMLEGLSRDAGLTIVVVSHDLRTVASGCDRVACLSRTLHYHESPRGLTPAVLAEVFRHDVSAIFGDVHVDAHRAGECGHSHDHGAGGAGGVGGACEGGKVP
ncbi:MAG: metal ABC transporter ATP-binding protein [Phycisphaeraceae bacterium]|nr:MAG: metal ABC transporter ATP-binding protein [Phycisphaeraceae bacterium]